MKGYCVAPCNVVITKLHLVSLPYIEMAGIAQSVRAGLSGDRIPMGVRLSAPVQTGPGAHPTSHTVGKG